MYNGMDNSRGNWGEKPKVKVKLGNTGSFIISSGRFCNHISPLKFIQKYLYSALL